MNKEFAYEQDAYAGKKMPNGLDGADQLCYQTLAMLYKRYSDGMIEREAASAEKRKILVQWRKQKELDEYYRKLAFQHADFLKRVELANTAYRKNRTLENADRLSRTIDGLRLENT